MELREFGARLRELRKQAGLTQRALADKAGIDFTYLSKIESGAKTPPSEKVILLLAEILNADKDELMALAGKVPADIAQMLKNQEILKFLRSEQAKKMVRNTNKKMGISIMKNLVNKRFSKVVIAAALACAIAASLWFASPVQALNITFPSLPSGTLGVTHTFTVKIDIQDTDLLPITKVDLDIYHTTSPNKVSLTNLPLATGSKVYTTAGGSVNVSAVTGAYWGRASASRYGYGYGYGHQF